MLYTDQTWIRCASIVSVLVASIQYRQASLAEEGRNGTPFCRTRPPHLEGAGGWLEHRRPTAGVHVARA
jgi:hypothetical protein